VICSPFEGCFHSIDFSLSTWMLHGRRPGSLHWFNKWLDGVQPKKEVPGRPP